MILKEAVKYFIESRPVVKNHNQSREAMFQALEEELQEAKESPDNLLGSELADLVWYVYTIAYNEGIDMDKEIELKANRNFYKYPADQLQEGNYDEIRERLREEWNRKGGDKLFYGII